MLQGIGMHLLFSDKDTFQCNGIVSPYSLKMFVPIRKIKLTPIQIIYSEIKMVLCECTPSFKTSL